MWSEKKTIWEAIRHESTTTTHQNLMTSTSIMNHSLNLFGLITLFISSFGLFMENNQEVFGPRGLAGRIYKTFNE
jgi:hypothetical protein